jgi:hypothetical protein
LTRSFLNDNIEHSKAGGAGFTGHAHAALEPHRFDPWPWGIGCGNFYSSEIPALQKNGNNPTVVHFYIIIHLLKHDVNRH